MTVGKENSETLGPHAQARLRLFMSKQTHFKTAKWINRARLAENGLIGFKWLLRPKRTQNESLVSRLSREGGNLCKTPVCGTENYTGCCGRTVRMGSRLRGNDVVRSGNDVVGDGNLCKAFLQYGEQLTSQPVAVSKSLIESDRIQ